jgi:hypothetical protein
MSIDKQVITLPIKLNASRAKMFLLFAGAIVFVIIGLTLMKSGSASEWGGVIFFGVCALVFLVCMLPGASSLLLTTDGFTMTSMYRASFTPWRSVASFGVTRVSGNRMVGFVYRDDAQVPKLGRAISAGLSGGAEGALPDTYGMKAEALIDLMSHLHELYGK